MCGSKAANTLMKRVLMGDGVDIAVLEAEGRLRVIQADMVDAAVPEVIEAVQSAISRGAPLVRMLGHAAGWETATNEDAVVEQEAAFDRAMSGSRCVAVCPYRVNAISGHTMLRAALQTHRSVIFNGSIVDNPFYDAAESEESPDHRS